VKGNNARKRKHLMKMNIGSVLSLSTAGRKG